MPLLVGLTYDLRDDYLAAGCGELETAEFDRPDTIDAIERTLQSLGLRTDRIGNAMALTRRLVAGDRWDLVFNICEGMHGIGREAQVPAILDLYQIPYVFSDPLVLALTLHKGMTNRVVRDLGIPTADLAVVADEDDLAAVDLPFPLFAKPVAEGTGKGVTAASRATDRAELEAVVRHVWNEFRQPALVETFLPGREFTVGIVGTGRNARPVGVMEIHLRPEAEAQVYSYMNKENCEELVDYAIAHDATAREAAAVALAAWRGLGCRDGGRIDVRCDARGRPCFIEVNPLAGLHPEHSDLPIICNLQGIAYRDLIGWIMESALERLGLGQPAGAR